MSEPSHDHPFRDLQSVSLGLDWSEAVLLAGDTPQGFAERNLVGAALVMIFKDAASMERFARTYCEPGDEPECIETGNGGDDRTFITDGEDRFAEVSQGIRQMTALAVNGSGNADGFIRDVVISLPAAAPAEFSAQMSAWVVRQLRPGTSA